MITRLLFIAAGLLLAAALALGIPVTITFDKTEVNEGDALVCTIARQGTDGDLTVKYASGMPKIPVASVTASDQWANSVNNVIDGRLDTFWQNRGNSKDEGKDDNPSLTFIFEEPTVIGAMHIANYVNPGHSFRGPKMIVIETSGDGTNFTPLATRELRRGADNSRIGVFETVPIPETTALAVRVRALSNYSGREFGKGTSMEGSYSNGSIVGLMEVEFTRPGAVMADIQTLAANGVVIPDGQSAISFPVRTLDDKWIEGDEELEIRLLYDEQYAIGAPASARVKIIDNDFGDVVSIVATEASAQEAGAKPGRFTISRTGTTGDLQVRYATSTQPVPIIAANASSSHNASPAGKAHDGSLETNWHNTGNAARESEQDDEPWIVFTFDQVYTIGQMRVANYRQSGHNFRGVKEFELLIATDMVNFTSLGTRVLPVTPDNVALPEFTLLDLGGVEARRVMLRILSNHANRTFWQGTSFEGNYANGSYVALSEVECLTGSTAGNHDLKEPLSGTITIPDGQQSITLSIIPLDDGRKEGDETIVLTLVPDFITYTVSERNEATVTIIDNE